MTDTSSQHPHQRKAFFRAEDKDFMILFENNAALPVILDAKGNPFMAEDMPMLQFGYKPEAMHGLVRYVGPIIYKHTGKFLHHLYLGDIQFQDTWEKCNVQFNNLDIHPHYKPLVKEFGAARFPTGRRNGDTNELLLIFQNQNMLDIQLPEDNTLMWGNKNNSRYYADHICLINGPTAACYGRNGIACLAQPVWGFRKPLI